MDIKSCNESLMKQTVSKQFSLNVINQSIETILNSGIEYEFRTTLYPLYFQAIDDILNIARYLKASGINQYVLQEYVDDYVKLNIKPFEKMYLSEVLSRCNEIINTKLKGNMNENY
jgi:pyruvate formate lyase activating enzyme